jgi:hypothetical protein
MALAHTPALLNAWRASLRNGLAANQLVPCIVLTGSMVLFLLKVGNVRFLRAKLDRRTCFIFCIVVALLHVNVGHESEQRALMLEYNEIVATTLVAGRLLLQRHQCRTTRAANHGRTTTELCHPTFAQQVLADSFLTHSWTLVHQASGVRAPPVCPVA